MASVKIVHQFPDEAITTVTIVFEDSYPDAMARACDEAVRCWRSTCTEDASDGED